MTHHVFDEARIVHRKSPVAGREHEDWILLMGRCDWRIGVRMRLNGVHRIRSRPGLASSRPLYGALRSRRDLRCEEFSPDSGKPLGFLCAALGRRRVPNPNYDLAVAFWT